MWPADAAPSISTAATAQSNIRRAIEDLRAGDTLVYGVPTGLVALCATCSILPKCYGT